MNAIMNGFPGGSEIESNCNAVLILGLVRSPGGENGNPLQYYFLENPTDRGAWRATVHRIAESLRRLSTQTAFLTVP